MQRVDNLTNSVVNTWLSLRKEKNEITSFRTNSKINSKWITCLYMKTKTFKLLEENIGEHHYDYDLVGKNFSDSTINHRGND